MNQSGGLSLGSSYAGTDAGAGNMIISGNVGIGTTSPAAALDVNGLQIVRGNLQLRKDTTNIIGSYTSDGSSFQDVIMKFNSYDFSIGSTNRMYIANSGNVGIGTTAPGGLFDTAASYQSYTGGHSIFTNVAPATTAAGQQANTYFNNFNNLTGILVRKTSTGTGDYLAIEDSSNNGILYVKSSGNVGIGTTSPSQMLTVGNNNQFTVTSAGAVTAAALTINGNITMNGHGMGSVGGVYYAANSSLGIGGIITNTGSIGQEVMAVSQTSDVAITPTYNDSGTGITNTDLLIQRTETSLGTTPGAQYLFEAGTSTNANLFSVTDTGQVYMQGNVGIGTTSPSQLLTVGNNNQFTVDSSGNVVIKGTTTFSNNATFYTNGYFNLNNGGLTNTQSVFSSNSAGANLTLGTNNSTGNLIFDSGTQVEAMRITSSGNVGIGNTAPSRPLTVKANSSSVSALFAGNVGIGGSDATVTR